MKWTDLKYGEVSYGTERHNMIVRKRKTFRHNAWIEIFLQECSPEERYSVNYKILMKYDRENNTRQAIDRAFDNNLEMDF